MWRKITRSLRNNFFLGLLVVTPVVATALIVNFLFMIITDYLSPLVPKAWLREHLFLHRISVLLLVIAALSLVGLFIRNYVGRTLYQLSDKLMTRLPFVNTIYTSIRQISETMFASRRMLFKEPVIIEFPKSGAYALGFLMSTLPAGMHAEFERRVNPGEWVAVFVPTAPNPTSGFLVMTTRASLIPAAMSAADAMKMIISIGAVTPGEGQKEITLMDKIKGWANAGEQGAGENAQADNPGATPRQP